MHGSLDQPPIMLRAKRWRLKLARQLVLSLVPSILLAAEYFQPGRHGPVAVWAIVLCSALVGYGVVARAWQFMVRPRIEITPTHLIEHVGWQRKQWSWDEVRNFRVVPWINAPALTFDRIDSRWFGFANADGMTTETLSFDYELDRNALAELLNQARGRWATGSAARRSVYPLVQRLSAGGMTRGRFWIFIALTAAVVATIDLSFQAFAFLGPIAAGLLCFAIGSARLRDIGWPRTYSVVVLMIAAYALVISFLFTSPWATPLSSAFVIAMTAPLGLFETNRALKAQSSSS